MHLTFLIMLLITNFHRNRGFFRSFTPFTRLFQSSSLEYQIRPANSKDIGKINECNWRNLPEHYTHDFYLSQISRFPSLSLVAETPQSELVGYVLGRIDVVEYPVDGSFYLGHLMSIAVDEGVRGNGVGRDLINVLHEMFVKEYGIGSVSLYCRKSNERAMNLYRQTFGYKIEKVIPEYYSDKEEAVYMLVHDLKKSYPMTKN